VFLPYVEAPDGKVLTQSGAIARLLAKKHNFYGKTECEFYNVERALAQLDDIGTELYKLFNAADDTKKALLKEFAEGKGKNLVSHLAKFLAENKTGYYAGSTPTIADFASINTVEYLRVASPELLKEFPEIEKHYTRTVEAVPAVKKWIAQRPVTQF